MRDELALRYLLLRQLWNCRRACDLGIYREVAESLVVTKDAGNFLVSWQRGGQSRGVSVPRTDYKFYGRGDRETDRGASREVSSANVARARMFSIEALGIDEKDLCIAENEEAREPHQPWSILGPFILFVLLLQTPIEVRFPILLLAILVTEFIPRAGRLLPAIGLSSLTSIGMPSASVFGGVAYLFARFLDPNPSLRGLSLTVGASGVIFGVWVLVATGVDNLMLLPLGLIVAMLPFIYLWIATGSHNRIVPFTLPTLGAGLWLDGYPTQGLLLNGYFLLSVIINLCASRILPVQRSRDLTANG